MNNFSIVTVHGAYLLDDGCILNFPVPTSVPMDTDKVCTFTTPVTFIDADNHELPGMSVDKFSIDSYLPDFKF